MSQQVRDYLISLDNESFFALYRNYIGAVETPYNKHDLVTELDEFFGREQTQSRILDLIDDGDLEVLSAVILLPQPRTGSVERFLGSHHHTFDVAFRIQNLRDRLLLIVDTQSENLTVNPRLRPPLEAKGMGLQRLIHGVVLPPTLPPPPSPWLTVELIVGLYSLWRIDGDVYRRPGRIKRRTVGELQPRFATVFPSGTIETRLDLVVTVASRLGLLTAEEKITIHEDSWDELGYLPPSWCHALLWAAAISDDLEEAFSLAHVVHDTVMLLSTTYAYSEEVLFHALYLTATHHGVQVEPATFRTLVQLGLFSEEGSSTDSPYYRLNPQAVRMLTPIETPFAAVRVDGNMEVIVPPGTMYETHLAIARISELTRLDTLSTYLITERAIARARTGGVTDPVAYLHAEVAEVPQNVRFHLSLWHARSQAVRMMRGLVLVAQPHEREILAASPAFQGLVKENLSDGVYLMVDDATRIERTLTDAGIGSATIVEGDITPDYTVPDYERLYRRLSPRGALPAPSVSSAPPSSPPPRHEKGEDTIKELLKAVAERTESEEARKELELRVQRKLILFPEQIRPEVLSHYATVARGLDYSGKLRLIEEAIKNGDILEVMTQMRSGGYRTTVVQPREVIERGEDLLLRALQEPELTPIRIRIRRMLLVRRLRGTLLPR